MKKRFIIFWLFILLSISTVFGIGVYDQNGKFTYYTNNNNPIISINISSPSQVINITSAEITYYNSTQIDSINKIMLPGESTILEFNLNHNITPLENIHFLLHTYDSNRNTLIPQGDKTDFYLRYDNNTAVLLSPDPTKDIYLTYRDTNGSFQFNEKISAYSLYLNSNLTLAQNSNSNYLSEYSNKIELVFDPTKLNEGLNNLTLIVNDIAGNSVTYPFKIFYRNEDLKLNLITKENDSNLKYNYNSQFEGLFNKTIYSSEENYTIKISTSKPSTCFYADTLSTFKNFNDFPLQSKKQFDSDNNGIIHTINVNAKAYPNGDFKKIWVSCVNTNIANDIAYLSDSLNLSNSLITLKVYTNSTLNIVDYNPKTEITSNDFASFVTTNTRTVCYFKLDSGSFNLMAQSQSYLTHSLFNISAQNGNHQITFKCFDVLNNIVEKTYDLNVDSTKGIKITSYSPKYFSTQQAIITMDLSEDVLCKYSSKQESPSSFINLTNTIGTGYKRNISTSLVLGKNTFYIYCEKGEISENSIEVYYDPNGPILSNLTFVNGKVESNYLANYNEINLKFDVKSLSSINKYYVIISYQNTTETRIITSNSASLNGKFENAKKIQVIGENSALKNGSAIEKTILFDIEDPVVTFLNNNGKITIVCFDGASGCYKTYYGIGSTPLDCKPKTSYGPNTNITIANNNYICAESYDKVGHRGFNQQLISSSISSNSNNNNNQNKNTSKINNTINFNNNHNSNRNEENTDEFENNNTVNSEEDPWQSNNFDNVSSEEKTNYLLIAAIVLILVSVSGGGYYAYKKGYLNKELEKFGIKKPKINEDEAKLGKDLASKTTLSKNDLNSNTGLTKGKYEDHLSKLNSFVDETISKKKNMFDKFETAKNKEKVKLNSPVVTKKTTKKTITQDNFDDFYLNSENNSSKKLETGNYKHEAENFEEYYQKKKKKDIENNKK